MFFKNKEWYHSKAILGSATTLLIAIFSIAISEGSNLTMILISIASIIGLYGRLDAKAKIKIN